MHLGSYSEPQEVITLTPFISTLEGMAIDNTWSRSVTTPIFFHFKKNIIMTMAPYRPIYRDRRDVTQLIKPPASCDTHFIIDCITLDGWDNVDRQHVIASSPYFFSVREVNKLIMKMPPYRLMYYARRHVLNLLETSSCCVARLAISCQRWGRLRNRKGQSSTENYKGNRFVIKMASYLLTHYARRHTL